MNINPSYPTLGLVMLSLVVILMHSHSFLMGQKMSMMLRIISTAAIYNKVLGYQHIEDTVIAIPLYVAS